MKTEKTTIENAISRLSYLVENGNKPNETDAEALNFIIDFVKSASEKKQETELLKLNSIYFENKRLAKEILYGACGIFRNDEEKKQYDKFCKNHKKAKKQIFKILKQMSDENNV